MLHGDLRSVAGEGAVGKHAVGEWFGEWLSTFESDYRFEIEETRDWDDRVLVVARHHGRGRSSGVPFSRLARWIYTVSGGKVVRCDVYPTRDEALQAAGLRE